MRKPISSRWVRVTSASIVRPARVSGITTTTRSCASPFEERTVRRSATGSSAVRASAAEVCHGCTSNRTHAAPSRANRSMPKAWSAEVRAPVSILALIQGVWAAGRPTHSRQPTSPGRAAPSSVRGAPWGAGPVCLDSDTPLILPGKRS